VEIKCQKWKIHTDNSQLIGNDAIPTLPDL
jgi:hypothetical protein